MLVYLVAQIDDLYRSTQTSVTWTLTRWCFYFEKLIDATRKIEAIKR